MRLLESVEAFEILAEVVKDEVLLEDGHDMPLLVVHDVSCYLRIVVLLRCQIFRVQCLLGQCFPKVMLICLHKQYLGAHRAQPIDAL